MSLANVGAISPWFRVGAYVRHMGDNTDITIPALDAVKDLRCVVCSGCSAVAPFTIREFEDGANAAQLATGWQLRMIATQVIADDGPGLAWRWDFYCPEHAGAWDPRPDGSWRVRARRPGPEDH